MNSNEAWKLVETQEKWLRRQLGTVSLPSEVSRADVLSELRIELYRACLQYDGAKAKPSTLAACVFRRRVWRIIKRLRSSESELINEPLAPEPDLTLRALSELRGSHALSDVERYAIDRLEKFGKLTLSDMRKRWPGEFVFAKDQSNYIEHLLNGIRSKL